MTAATADLAWLPPTKPNGIITRYRLFVNGSEAYAGLQTRVTLSHLSPFSLYSVVLEVCNRLACVRATSSGFLTSSAAPLQPASPSAIPSSATSVEVRWIPATDINGEFVAYALYRQVGGNVTLLYSGSALVFLDTKMRPSTSYNYSIVVVNTVGQTGSDWTTARTFDAAPEGLAVPVILVLGGRDVNVTWAAPRETYGLDTDYSLFVRDQTDRESLAYSGEKRSTIIDGLVPYTLYRMRVVACNYIGCITSGLAAARTSETAPQAVGAPVLTVASPYEFDAAWEAPAVPNGVVTHYRLFVVRGGEIPVVLNADSTTFSLTVTGEFVRPYTTFVVTLEACTRGGCVASPQAQATTLETPPADQPDPIVVALAAGGVRVQWSGPTEPNGDITRFDVWYRRVREERRRRDEPCKERSSTACFGVCLFNFIANECVEAECQQLFFAEDCAASPRSCEYVNGTDIISHCRAAGACVGRAACWLGAAV